MQRATRGMQYSAVLNSHESHKMFTFNLNYANTFCLDKLISLCNAYKFRCIGNTLSEYCKWFSIRSNLLGIFNINFRDGFLSRTTDIHHTSPKTAWMTSISIVCVQQCSIDQAESNNCIDCAWRSFVNLFNSYVSSIIEFNLIRKRRSHLRHETCDGNFQMNRNHLEFNYDLILSLICKF